MENRIIVPILLDNSTCLGLLLEKKINYYSGKPMMVGGLSVTQLFHPKGYTRESSWKLLSDSFLFEGPG